MLRSFEIKVIFSRPENKDTDLRIYLVFLYDTKILGTTPKHIFAVYFLHSKRAWIHSH